MEIFSQKAFSQAGAMMYAADSEKEAHGQYPLTLVTAWFDLGAGQKRYAGNPYPGWIRNFLPFVRWPLVVFCDEQSVDMLKEARGDKPAVWHVTRPEKFYVHKYLEDLKQLQCYGRVTVEASLVWHEKHHFLRQALSENPFGSEMLFWCDIGQFRYDPGAPLGHIHRMAFRLFEDIEWPDLETCRALPQDKVILVNAHLSHINAQFFGGAVEPSRRWCDAYYRCLEKRKQDGNLVHIEEFVMVSCWKRQRELVHIIPQHFVLFGGNWGRLGYKRYVLNSRRFPWKHFRLSFRWHFLKGGRFPWKYFFRRLSSGLAR